MLGHKSLETTRIYAPLNNKEIQKNASPLEQIMNEMPFKINQKSIACVPSPLNDIL